MRISITFGIFLFLYTGIGLVMPFGTKEEPTNREKFLGTVEIAGILRLVGNEPFTRLLISAEDSKDYFLQNGEDNSLRRFIGSKIRIKGTLISIKITTADGRDLGDEFVIRDFKILL